MEIETLKKLIEEEKFVFWATSKQDTISIKHKLCVEWGRPVCFEEYLGSYIVGIDVEDGTGVSNCVSDIRHLAITGNDAKLLYYEKASISNRLESSINKSRMDKIKNG